MATLTRSESIPQTISTPTTASKAAPASALASQKAGKQSEPSPPRIDLEPLYTALKAAIGDKWTVYKEAVSSFVLGKLDQDELSRKINSFVHIDPSREHLHNQFIAAIYGNAYREPPEPGVASWVSANDKPTTVLKPVSGDTLEQRLKTEIMQLPARERHRLKAIQDEPYDLITRTMNEYHLARAIKLPDIVPTSAGGFNKTNWEPEIRKRYDQPLSSETAEFPDVDSIQARMVPICYEEGVVGGCSPGCAELMNVVTETYIKEALSSFFGRVRSNGDHYIKTAAYKRQFEREEEMWLRGEVAKNSAGLLPVEVEANARRRPLDTDDLRLAVELGDSYLRQVPLVGERILGGGFEIGDDDRYDADVPRIPGAAKVNGVNGVNGINGHKDDEMLIDENDWGWPGGTAADRGVLDSVLDDCLAVGQ